MSACAFDRRHHAWEDLLEKRVKVISNVNRVFTSVKQAPAKHAARLAGKPGDQAAVHERRAPVSSLDDDWTLNEVK